jgi:uncharacterized caspase-like protein
VSTRRHAVGTLLGLPLGTLLGTSQKVWAQAKAPAASAGKGSRVALVVGNSAYPQAPLRNPINDAEAVASALEGLGFGVSLVRNAGWSALGTAVRGFADSSSSAQLRLVYYAGHGAQVRGRNYLIPVDVDVLDEDELLRKSVDAAELVQRLARQPKAVNVLVMDACRNNPASQVALAADGRRLRTRAGPAGMARMAAPAGSLIAYATAPGQVADDRAGGTHSLYTKHLLAHMATPGITLEQLFKRVRLGVLQESGAQQQPWEENSLTVDACLSLAQRCAT